MKAKAHFIRSAHRVQALFFDHPDAMFRVALSSMWIWFSYYGIKALLIAYMVTQLKLNESYSYAVLGTYSALVYGLQIFGGFLADRLLGFRKSIIWGSVLMIAGHILLALPYHSSFFYGLSFVAWGSGFFSGSDAAIVGTFYRKNNQSHKDAGFVIFYMITNVGMAMGGLLCGYVGQQLNWHYGFGLAGIFMVMGLINFIMGIGKNIGKPPAKAKALKNIFSIRPEIAVYLLSLAFVGATILLFNHTHVMDIVIPVLTLGSFVYVIYVAIKSTRQARSKMFALLFIFLVYAFWLALYEQSTGSLNLFILRNVDLTARHIKIPALAFNNFFPSFLLVLLTPVALKAWKQFRLKHLEIHSIAKLIIGVLAMGVYFGVLWLGSTLSSGTGMVPLYLLAAAYLFMEIGELCIAPTLTSSTYNLSPRRIICTMMSIAAISGSLGEYLAGKIGSMMVVPTSITDPIKTLPFYSLIFGKLALLTFVFAGVYIILYPLLKKWMQEVR